MDLNRQIARVQLLSFFTTVLLGVGKVEAARIVGWGWDEVVSETPTGNDFVAISGGEDHSLAQRSDGSIISWGLDADGQVSGTPAGTDFTAIAAGGYAVIIGHSSHSLALKSDGSIVSWGCDGICKVGICLQIFGQVSDTPTGNDFISIAAGDYHSLALFIPEPSSFNLAALAFLAVVCPACRTKRTVA